MDVPAGSARLQGVDAARGLAIALMVLSHTVKGLCTFKMMPDWGVVPVHLVTKFSSSLFVLCFGLGVAFAYLPKVGTEAWPAARWKMWKRALLIMVWYKILTWVQMVELYDSSVIVDALLFKRFPDFAEILQFYAWVMLLLPLALPLFARLALWPKLLVAYAVALASYLLQENFDFFGVWQLKAIVVEHKDAFCYGVLSRGALALAGIALGSTLVGTRHREERSRVLSAALLVLGLASLATFFALFWEPLDKVTVALSKNWGKHPPNFAFMSFSLGGAMVLLGLLLRARGWTAALLSPLALLGREALVTFNTHLIVIFLVFRIALGLRHEVPYPGTLALTGINLLLCGLAAWGKIRLKDYWERRRRERALADDDDEFR